MRNLYHVKTWGYNFSSTFEQNECKYLHYIFSFLPTFLFFLGYRPFLQQESGGEEKARRHCSHRCTDLGQSFVLSLYTSKYCCCTSWSGSGKSSLFSSLLALPPSMFFSTWTKKKGNLQANKSIGSKDWKSLEDLKHIHWKHQIL